MAFVGEALLDPKERRWGFVAAILLFALLAGWLHQDVLRDPSSTCHVSNGDTRLNRVILEWGRHQIVDEETRPLWDLPQFAPSDGVLAWSENLLGNQLLYTPLREAFGDEGTAFAWWVVLCHLLDFFVVYGVARRRGHRPAVALWGALLFAFSHARLRQFGHQQMLPQFWSVLAVDSLLRFFEQRRGRSLLAASVLSGLQFWFGIYLGLILELLLVLMLLVRLLQERSLALFREHGRAWCAALLLGGVLIAPLLPPYLAAARAFDSARPLLEAWAYAPGLLQVLHPCEFTLLGKSGLFDFARPDAFPEEKVLYPGIATIWALLLALGPILAWGGRALRGQDAPGDPEERSTVLLGASAFLLFLCVFSGSPLFAAAHFGLPGFGAIRAPGRLVLLAIFPLFLALARLLSRRPGLAALFCCLTAVEAVGTFPAPSAELEEPGLHQSIANETPPDAVLLHLPVSLQPKGAVDIGLTLDYLAGLPVHWRATVNGYSGLIPPTQVAWAQKERRATRTDSLPTFLQEMREGGVTHAAVHLARMGQKRRLSWLAFAEERPDQVLASSLSWMLVALDR